jgi:hypothetical protein
MGACHVSVDERMRSAFERDGYLVSDLLDKGEVRELLQR